MQLLQTSESHSSSNTVARGANGSDRCSPRDSIRSGARTDKHENRWTIGKAQVKQVPHPVYARQAGTVKAEPGLRSRRANKVKTEPGVTLAKVEPAEYFSDTDSGYDRDDSSSDDGGDTWLDIRGAGVRGRVTGGASESAATKGAGVGSVALSKD